MNKRSLNYITLLIFAPILILAGVLGFALPDGVTSGAPAYNVFHLIFGLFGLALVLTRREDLIRGFNISFGLIDLYQLLASLLHWFPERHFQWKTWDDYLHAVIGAALVLIGLFGRKKD
jgi:uncharacterized membrane protein